MAMAIKETPVLTGKNAVRFEKIIKQNEKKTVKKEDYERAIKAYVNLEIV